jgi:hypothetical protein
MCEYVTYDTYFYTYLHKLGSDASLVKAIKQNATVIVCLFLPPGISFMFHKEKYLINALCFTRT